MSQSVTPARIDETSAFRVVRRSPLLFQGGPVPEEDLPSHVRGASAIQRFGSGFAIVQDDVNAIGLLAGEDAASLTTLLLPRGKDGSRQFDDGRNNKHLRFDFESAIVTAHEGVESMVIFGSGSSKERESVALVTCDALARTTVTIREATSLYGALRRDEDFAGSELNMEGAVLVGEGIWFFQRGNGKPSNTRPAVDAVTRLPLDRLMRHLESGAPLGETRETRRYDLGAIEERATGGRRISRSSDPVEGPRTRLTFTDATAFGSEVWFLAAAEASPDARSDGPVAGACVGRFDATGTPWLVPLVDTGGNLVREKVEGLVFVDAETMLLVVDHDSPSIAAELWVARRESRSPERLSR